MKKAAKGKASGKGRGDGALTALQQAFIEQYCVTLNATEALRRVRQSQEVTRQAASEIRRNPKVADEISKRLRERGEHTDGLRREVLETLAAILRANVGDVVDLQTQQIKSRIPRNAQIALSELNIKTYEGGTSARVKLSDKSAAAERLAKLLGMFEKSDPLEQEREQIRDAGATIVSRVDGLRARLVKRVAPTSPDGSGTEGPSL